MKMIEQKIYNYLTIFVVAMYLGIFSYPFHESNDFKLFHALKKPKIIETEDYELNISCTNLNDIISYSQLKSLVDLKCVRLIDARSISEIYDEKIDVKNDRIAGASVISVEDIDDIIEDYYELGDEIYDLFESERVQALSELYSLPKNEDYIVYCGSSECDKSERLVDYMKNDFEFTKVSIYKGGWEEWREYLND